MAGADEKLIWNPQLVLHSILSFSSQEEKAAGQGVTGGMKKKNIQASSLETRGFICSFYETGTTLC